MRRDCGFEAGQRVTGLSPPLSASPQVGKGEGVESESEMGGKKKKRKISAPSACPSMRDGVRGSYIYAIHYVFG